MNRMWIALIAVVALIIIPWVGVGAMGLTLLFGAGIPYIACLVFFAGFIYRIVN